MNKARTMKVVAKQTPFLLVFTLLATGLFAQGPSKRSLSPRGGEARAAAKLEKLRNNPLDLRAFLFRMPKGGDLHNHLSGAVYAETFIRDAAEDNLCVDTTTLSFVKPQLSSEKEPGEDRCSQGTVPASRAYKDQDLYDALVDAFSMRSFVPSAGISGHDHFFDTFAKFGGTDRRHLGEWIDEVASRAAAQNEQYLELMHTPKFSHLTAILQKIGWEDDFAKFRSDLLNAGLRDDVALAKTELDEAEAVRQHIEHCGEAQQSSACKVSVRYLYQILRGFPKEQVFAQTLLGFEVAAADPRVVGINYVMPEDGYTSMNDYALHMRIVGFLHELYPQVHITLHAGELAPGLVPPEGLCCHIRLAVEQAHAERIGHGVDVMYETDPEALLREMVKKHVMVEVNLSSNDLILGVSGKAHPFLLYRKFQVPVALSTDDEGVSRIDLTHEFVRAVQTYELRYLDLKNLARTSLEHSFLSGASLWAERDDFTRMNSACSKDSPDERKQSAACAAFLESNSKAKQQWELERRFAAFEAAQ